ncbi:hypothetical protein GALMADRAFT_248814 [Galerina marginata CBS 339.88]|uniref:Microbial-type PARG catalytic domain-containing protein n=1 Tax=Galerina marginata (strain CBS 339.88) TaxID=685588 RepID=A0A067T513_GALM3|nr:hypothetical protein GALMADRAFT_248814 [Galerina marginata CBS 339.88]
MDNPPHHSHRLRRQSIDNPPRVRYPPQQSHPNLPQGNPSPAHHTPQASRPYPQAPQQAPSRDRQSRRVFLQNVALATVEAINNGIVDVSKTQSRTRLFLPDAPELVNWRQTPPQSRRYSTRNPVSSAVLSMSTTEGAHYLHSLDPTKKIGVLNFASATHPGGGFLEGAKAQEESIARASSLYVSLITETARPFYALHDKDEKGGFYSHAMIYSPNIHIFRDDAGGWIAPFEVDVLTSPAVNAGKARKVFRKVPHDEIEARIQEHMKERMARVLALFEKQGARNLVLGSFGTGVFRNDVKAMARIWRDLLLVPGARFAMSFDAVAFTIPDSNTKHKFESVFNVLNPIPVQI